MSETTHQIMNVRDCRTCPFHGFSEPDDVNGVTRVWHRCSAAGRDLNLDRVAEGLLPAWCPIENAPVLVRLDPDRRS